MEIKCAEKKNLIAIKSYKNLKWYLEQRLNIDIV